MNKFLILIGVGIVAYLIFISLMLIVFTVIGIEALQYPMPAIIGLGIVILFAAFQARRMK
jgi:hypothetical protein